jgi:PhnB protein
MKLVHFYLNFPGTAKEALEFYGSIFGTKIISCQTYGETPFAGEVPDAMKDKIINAQLPITESVHLMACDSGQGYGPALIVGNNFNIMVVAQDKNEIDEAFSALSEGGKITMPLANAPWGPYFGMCVDKYGIQWMLSLEHPV